MSQDYGFYGIRNLKTMNTGMSDTYIDITAISVARIDNGQLAKFKIFPEQLERFLSLTPFKEIMSLSDKPTPTELHLVTKVLCRLVYQNDWHIHIKKTPFRIVLDQGLNPYLKIEKLPMITENSVLWLELKTSTFVSKVGEWMVS